MAKIFWTAEARSIFDALPPHVQDEIDEKLSLLRHFPRMYKPITIGRWRRHRRFLAAEWFIYYRIESDTVFIRGLWPARMLDLPLR